MAQTPNIEAQRTALKKLSFLIGEWSGEASAARGPGIVVELSQTEVAEFKLDGEEHLILREDDVLGVGE